MNDAAPMRPITITRAGITGTMIVVIVAALCVRLGFWQLERLGERRARNQLVSERTTAAPLPLTRIPRDTAQLIFRRVLLNGRFDHHHSIALAGRSLRGVPGVYVLTPLLLPSAEGAILVNRGWVPAADGSTVNFDSLASPLNVTGSGLIVPFPSRQGTARPTTAAAPPRTSFRRVWFTVDPAALRAQFPYRIADFQIQLSPGDTTRQYPIPLPLPQLDDGPHLGYAIQWFSFALIAIIGWLAIALKKGEISRR